MDCLELGPVPSEESCQQVGTKSYDAIAARAECVAFKNQIIRVCGPEPDGVRIIVKSNPHDFGSYYEVAVRYDDSDQESIDYAFRVESTDIPNWDDQARKELGLDVAKPIESNPYATAYVEWGGAYDVRRMELIEYKGRFQYEDLTGGHVSLSQDSTYKTAENAKSALLKVVFILGEENTYIDFETGGIVRKRDSVTA